MKVLRAGILAVAVLSSFSSLAPSPVAAEEAVAVDPGFAAAELMAVSGVDLVFAQFAATIADSAQSQGITTDAHFLATWERTALAAFDAATLNSALEIALTGAFTSDEQAALEGFYNSDFGRRVVGIEKAVQTMAPSDQTAAVAQGLAAFEALAADSRRLAQIEELLVLAGAELTPELVRQSSSGAK